MDDSNFNSLLQMTIAYSENATAIFNLFITVVFGSLAFAATMPLKSIGGRFLNLSGASWVCFISLSSFYLISFLAFVESERHALALFNELYQIAKTWGLSADALKALNPGKFIYGLSIHSLGLAVGSVCNLAIFMWLANSR